MRTKIQCDAIVESISGSTPVVEYADRPKRYIYAEVKLEATDASVGVVFSGYLTVPAADAPRIGQRYTITIEPFSVSGSADATPPQPALEYRTRTSKDAP